MSYTKYKVVDRGRVGGLYDIVHIGTDSSGRPLYMSNRMWGAWLAVMDELGDDLANKIDITQGAFMKFAGGGAADSAGYHDLSSCIDTRVWDLTGEEQGRVIRCARRVGWAAWLRNIRHGGFTDEHTHWTLLDEMKGVPGGGGETSASGAQAQWASYRAGNDGLASNGDDYHWRPVRPLPVFNLEKWKDDTLPSLEEIANQVWSEEISADADKGPAREKMREAANQAAEANAKVTALAKEFDEFRTNIARRDKDAKERDEALKQQLTNVANALEAKLDSIDDQVS